MTMITPSYLGETIEYSSLHACRSTLEDPTRKQPRNTKINISIATEKDIIAFSNEYCKVLNTIYQLNNKKYVLTKITEGNAYYICEIIYTDKNILKPIFNKQDKVLDDLLYEWNTSGSMRINKIIRIYGENIIRIIKPKQLRFWIKSKALRDVDETFDDILRN